MYEFFYDDEATSRLLAFIDAKLSGQPFSSAAVERIMHDRESLENHRELDRLNRYIPVLTGEKTTILDLFEDPIVCFFDYHRVLEQFDIMIRETTDWYLATNDYAKMGFDMLFDLRLLPIRHKIAMDFLDRSYPEAWDDIIKIYGREPVKYDGDFEAFLRDAGSLAKKNTLIVALRTVKVRDNLVDMLRNTGSPSPSSAKGTNRSRERSTSSRRKPISTYRLRPAASW